LGARYCVAMSRENVESVRRFYAIGDRQPEELTDDFLGEFFDPEVEYHTIPHGMLGGVTYVGFEGLRRFWTNFFGAWDELALEVQEIRQAGDDLVIGVVRAKGRMRDREVEEVFSAVFTLRNARIVRVQAFGSREGAFEAAGLSE
jgi:ketosteroid isomerase-like protein